MGDEFSLSEREYVSANRLATKPTRKHILIYGMSFLLLVLCAVFGPNIIVQSAAIGGLVGGATVHVIARFLYAPWQTKKQYRSYLAIQEKQVVSLNEDGVSFVSSIGEGNLPWKNIIKWRENDDHILLYQAQEIYHIVPKHVSISTELALRLSKKVGKSS